MNPVLIAGGCGNESVTSAGVKGCNAWGLHETDPMRSCPLHPSKPDRDLIAAAPDLYAACEAAEKCLADYVNARPNNVGPVMQELNQLRAALRLARGEAGDNNKEAK